METRKRAKALYVYNLLLVLLTALGWTITVLYQDPEGILSTRGLANLRYFTVLSNVFEGVASLLLAVRLGRMKRGKADGVPHRLFLLKFLAAVTVAVTFFVVALFFGPWIGWAPLYRGANFWFHLVIPLLAMGEFTLLDRFDRLSFRETGWAPLPALIYGVVYTLNVLINGVGEPPDANDFYGFVHWGLPVGLFIFAMILLLSWGSGCLLRWGNGVRRDRAAEKTE